MGVPNFPVQQYSHHNLKLHNPLSHFAILNLAYLFSSLEAERCTFDAVVYLLEDESIRIPKSEVSIAPSLQLTTRFQPDNIIRLKSNRQLFIFGHPFLFAYQIIPACILNLKLREGNLYTAHPAGDVGHG